MPGRKWIVVALSTAFGTLGACSPTDQTPSGRTASTRPAAFSEQLADPVSRLARARYVQRAQAEGAHLAGYEARSLVAPGAAEQRVVVGNPAMRFVSELGTEGLRIAPAGKTWSAGLALRRFGCGSDVSEVEREAPRIEGVNRVSYARRAGAHGFSEWYVNGPLGLEQGFTVEESPCAGSATNLKLELAVDGLRPEPLESGDIALVNANGNETLRYSDLSARDASGKLLPARMVVRDQRVALQVDVASATYPIEIDPLLWFPQTIIPGSGDFAFSLALSGNTALIGEPGSCYAEGDNYAWAWGYTRTGSQWSNSTTVGIGQCRFAMAVDIDGDTAVVTSLIDHLTNVYRQTGASWTLEKELKPSGSITYDYFGGAVAIEQDTVVVGAQFSAPGGAAYVYTRAGSVWSEKKLVASDAADDDIFGNSVAISGNTIVVGAPKDDTTATDQGAAYVFTRSGSVWTEQQKLIAPGTAAVSDWFGASVAISGDTMVIGAGGRDAQRGAAFVFVRNGTWSFQQQLTASDRALNDHFGGYYDDESGFARGGVAVGADMAVVTAMHADTPGANSGAAYLFTRVGSVWSQQQKLIDNQDRGLFGWSVSLSGDTALIGSKQAGHVFVLRKDLGDPCSSGPECGSGHCVDGRCCDVACAGACDACSEAAGAVSDGTCSLVAGGSSGAPLCMPQACTGASANCAPCTSDQHCTPGTYCAADGSCQSRKAEGLACDTAAGADCLMAGCRACASDHCVDGVCCESACAGCFACSTAITGDVAGKCAPVPAGSDPRDVCDPDVGFPASCLADGECDGSGSCRALSPAGTACAATTCAAGTVTGFICDGAGVCEEGSAACGNYACAGTACGDDCADDTDCNDEKAYCLAGSCVNRGAPGKACTEGRECTTGFCADGVCCNTECQGQCEACAEPGTVGTCTPILDEPRGERPPCTSGDADDACSATLCDGEDGTRCAGFVGASVSCRVASCSDGSAVIAAECDGTGACPVARTTECAPYVCSGTACGEDCSSDDDCADDFHCDPSNGECVARDEAMCSADGLRQIRPDKSERDCAPYVCDSGECLTSCDSSTQCSGSFVCDTAEGACVAAVTETSNGDAAAEEEGGCGCRLPRSTAPVTKSSWLLAAAALAGLLRRRGARHV